MGKQSEETAILVAQAGPLNGMRWQLRRKLMIGRDSDCDLVVNDRQVSRHHACITPTQDGVLLEDLGSKNGTHRNGQAFSGTVALHDGDVIQIALAQQFVFMSSDATLPLDDDFLQAPNQVTPGKLYLEKRSRRVWIGSQEILPPLSLSQFHLLEMVYENPGRVIARSDLIRGVWGEEQAIVVSEQALDALVRRLRDRLAEYDPDHPYIVTVRGHGLRLDNPPAE
jgi:DNA-binding winged helix-turn-helix (wHTH) protein